MALYRMVSTGFWTDSKVIDDFTPEDRYFYLYLFTNPHTNLCGCYEISIRQISNEIGYSKQSVENLIVRFSEVHRVILYSGETKEILLLNWNKYNWTKSEKFMKALRKELDAIKNNEFREYLESVLNGMVSIPYQYRMDTTNTNTITNTDSDTKYQYKAVIDYLNEKAGTAFKDKSKDSRSHIKARFDDGFSLDDFKTVIDKKVAEWGGTDMAKFLRPSTLFGTKFESYLNQQAGTKNTTNRFNNFEGRSYDYDDLERQLLAVQGGNT